MDPFISALQAHFPNLKVRSLLPRTFAVGDINISLTDNDTLVTQNTPEKSIVVLVHKALTPDDVVDIVVSMLDIKV